MVLVAISRRDWHRGSAMVDGLWNIEEGENHLGQLPDLKVTTLPTNPFTPRSLPGMSQGARKMAAIWDATEPGQPTVAAWVAAYDAARIKYRIGERIRPCPGKHGCVNCTRTCGFCEDQCPDDTRCKRCGTMMTSEGPFCDGSGVCPARRKARR